MHGLHFLITQITKAPRVAMGLVVLLALFPQLGQAQKSSLQGIVRASGENRPLEGAHVVLEATRRDAATSTTTTDTAGRYLLEGIEAGAYILRVRYVGYEERRLPITIREGTPQTRDVDLIRVPVYLNPILVSASRNQEKMLDSPAAITVLEAETLEKEVLPSTVAALRTVTGVDIAQVGLDRYHVSLRGFNDTFASRTLTLVDYRRAAFPGLVLNAFSSMPIASLDIAQVEVVRGPGSALYGGGVEQGVIHFLTKDPFSFSGTSAQLTAGGHDFWQGAFRHAGVWHDRLGYKLVGSYSQGTDWAFDATDPDDEPRFASLNEAFRDYDYGIWKGYLLGEVAYRFSPATTLTAQGGYTTIKQILYSNVGENQVDGFASVFGQIRFQAGQTFALASLSQTPKEAHLLSYRTNRANINHSSEVNVQVQHMVEFLQQRATLIAGADVRALLLDTGGTLHGRNEADNDFVEGGVYLHTALHPTHRLDVTLASRLDYNTVLDRTVLSPRAAVVFKPVPAHSIRLTYNRAFSMPNHGAFFLDNVVGNTGDFVLRLRGNREGWSYPDPLHTTSFLPGLGRYAGVGLPLQAAYQSTVEALVTGGILHAVPNAEALIAHLEARIPEISGFSEGELVLNGQVIDRVPTLDPVKESITHTIELGYKGVLGNQVLLNLDAYYTRKKDFVSRGLRLTPLVTTPGVGQDLHDAVAGAFTDEELASFGLDRSALADLFEQAAVGLADTPIGLIETIENYDPDTSPEALVTFINFGDLDFFGFDAGLEAHLSENLQMFLQYSWVSHTLFDEEDLGEPGTGLEAALNAPPHKATGGITYRKDRGWQAGAAGRYVDAFEVRSGVHQGRLDAYFVLDLHLGYEFSSYVRGLQLDVTVQNLFNQRHREYVGAPKVGRLMLARLSYSF